jgi:hypothetical protein
MSAPIDVQQHPRERASLPLASMHPALALPAHQARSLQGFLYPAVAQPAQPEIFELLN